MNFNSKFGFNNTSSIMTIQSISDVFCAFSKLDETGYISHEIYSKH